MATPRADAGFWPVTSRPSAIQSYHFLVEDELERGELVEVLAPFGGRRRRFSLLYPRDTAKRPAVRALVNYTLEQARGDLELA